MRHPTLSACCAALALVAVAGCAPLGGTSLPGAGDGVYAPGVDPHATAEDGVEVGHRLMAADEYELALRAFNRAALSGGMTAEILLGLGSANLQLGRLGQAETLLRRAAALPDAWPEIYNNLGVVLMERDKTAEATQVFRQAFALDNGESDLIRDNLRLALAKSANSVILTESDNAYKLIRRGRNDVILRPID